MTSSMSADMRPAEGIETHVSAQRRPTDLDSELAGRRLEPQRPPLGSRHRKIVLIGVLVANIDPARGSLVPSAKRITALSA